MNQLQIFKHPSFGQVEIIEIDGKPWFGASKTASALGYVNPRDAISKHCRVEGVAKRDTLTDGGSQEMNFIDEGNLYRLIVKSKLPLAEKYERWVFDDVLPQIRKTGTYSITPQHNLPQNYLEALKALVGSTEMNEALQLQNACQEQQLKTQAPKVALYDTAMNAGNNFTVMHVAKTLGIGRNKLFDFLRDKKVLMKNNLPYESYVTRGYFEVRQYTIAHFTTGLENKTQTLVTPKGMAWIHNLLVGEKEAN